MKIAGRSLPKTGHKPEKRFHRTDKCRRITRKKIYNSVGTQLFSNSRTRKCWESLPASSLKEV